MLERERRSKFIDRGRKEGSLVCYRAEHLLSTSTDRVTHTYQRSELKTMGLSALHLRVCQSRKVGRISVLSQMRRAGREESQHKVHEVSRVIGAVN